MLCCLTYVPKVLHAADECTDCYLLSCPNTLECPNDYLLFLHLQMAWLVAYAHQHSDFSVSGGQHVALQLRQSLSDAGAASSSSSSCRSRSRVSEEVSIPWPLQSRQTANPPVLKHLGSNWLQEPLTGVHPVLEAGGNLVVTCPVLCHSVKLDLIRKAH